MECEEFFCKNCGKSMGTITYKYYKMCMGFCSSECLDLYTVGKYFKKEVSTDGCDCTCGREGKPCCGTD